MGSDNLFAKRRLERQQRKEAVIKQKSSKWLVICEGVQTEVNYFQEVINDFNKNIEDKYKLDVKIVGKGMNTVSLVSSVDDLLNQIDEYRNLSTIPYGKIFVVFDKDSFDKNLFDRAIDMCNKNGYIPLWSNQALEFWFLLYFNYIDSKIDRNLYAEKLEEYFSKCGLKYKYKKNDKTIYSKLKEYGNLEKAKKNAKRIHSNHSNDLPSDSESCTTVYKFFEEIDERLKELE